jgi:hypothetical protein
MHDDPPPLAYGFFRYDFQCLDDRGNAIYRADKITPMEMPNGMKNVARVWYDDDTDTLVAAEQGKDMRPIGHVLICKNYLAGNREAVSFQPAAVKHAGCIPRRATTSYRRLGEARQDMGQPHVRRSTDPYTRNGAHARWSGKNRLD